MNAKSGVGLVLIFWKEGLVLTQKAKKKMYVRMGVKKKVVVKTSAGMEEKMKEGG